MVYVSCLGVDFGLVLTEITVASDTPAPFRQVRETEVLLYTYTPEPPFVCTAGLSGFEAVCRSPLVSPL